MAKIKRDTESTQLYFRCPGCKHLHALNDDETDPKIVHPFRPYLVPIWSFNKDYDKPTINPSYLSYSPDPAVEYRCHSFIKDGMIQFLSDCTHELKGQAVELPEV